MPIEPFDDETTPLRRAPVIGAPTLGEPPGRSVQRGLARLARIADGVAAYARSHRRDIVATLAALVLGVFAPWLLQQWGFAAPIASSLRAMNLDEERIALVSQALATLGGAFVAAALTRRRAAALAGASAYILLWYILPFAANAQYPPPGPGGVTLEPRPGALQQVTLTLAGFGVVAAGAGAALGGAFGALAIAPLATLVAAGWRRLQRRPAGTRMSATRAALSLALAAVFVAALAIVGSNAGNLLMYGLTSDLYRVTGAPAHGGQARDGQSHQVQMPSHGHVSSVQFFSPALGMKRAFFIYLPPSYSIATARRYPTLYLLHGSPGGPGDWVYGGQVGEIEDALVTAGKIRETILVSPDGNGPKARVSEWVNTFDGRQRMEDAIAGDLVRYVDQHYRTLADAADRAIAGISEGGYGAANIALHHPEMFSQVGSFGGYFEAPANETGVFGSASSPARAYNSPSQFVATAGGNRAAHRIVFYIGVGAHDRANLYISGVNFAAKLQQMGVQSRLLTSPGAHSWSVWIDQLTTTMELMEPPAATAATA